MNVNVPHTILQLTPKSTIRLDPIDKDRILVKIGEQTFCFSPTMPIFDNREKWLSVIQNQIESLTCTKRPPRETDKQQIEKIEICAHFQRPANVFKKLQNGYSQTIS